jgi:hypothetical protein
MTARAWQPDFIAATVRYGLVLDEPDCHTSIVAMSGAGRGAGPANARKSRTVPNLICGTDPRAWTLLWTLSKARQDDIGQTGRYGAHRENVSNPLELNTKKTARHGVIRRLSNLHTAGREFDPLTAHQQIQTVVSIFAAKTSQDLRPRRGDPTWLDLTLCHDGHRRAGRRVAFNCAPRRLHETIFATRNQSMKPTRSLCDGQRLA